jgi:3-oxoacyl-[acyl-carrier protein] reductase
MDLGIKGRKAIVCASSKGLGRACAMALAREGVEIVINARGADVLDATAKEIRGQTGAKVTAIACDVTTPEGQKQLLAACPDPDILVNNAGGPPHGDFREWNRDHWIKALIGNMITPIELIKAVVDGMIARRFGRIVNITSSSTRMPVMALGLSNGARTGLAGFIAGLSRQTVRHNVTINNLLPGPFDTDRLASSFVHAAKAAGRAEADVRAERAAQNPSGRFGLPAEFGDACAFLCSAQMGYVTGQHFLMDGGAYPGTF